MSHRALPRTRRRLLVGLTLALSMALPAAALAAGDDVAADGDGVVPITELGPMQLGTVCLGAEVSRTALVAAKRVTFTGVTTWQNSATVSISINQVLGDGLAATVPAAPDNALTLPANWVSAGDGAISADYVESSVTFTPAATGAFTGLVSYQASGQRAAGGIGNHTETGGFNVFANVVECPVIAITTPTQDATYLIDSIVAADYSCSSTSAIVTCAGPVADGGFVDTATVGDRAFTVDAENAVGGTASESVTYRVIYRFDYIGPTLEVPGANFVTAGQKRNIRFTMYGKFGPDVIKGWPRHRRVDCDTGAPLGSFSTGRIANFRYVSSLDQYVLAWKTNPAWDGTCRDFVVRLRDGTQRTARFTFATPCAAADRRGAAGVC